MEGLIYNSSSQAATTASIPKTNVTFPDFKEECRKSVQEAEEEYRKTGKAYDFEEMMNEFGKEFKW